MNKEFYLETYNYKYNAWLPCEIIEKLDDKIVKVRCYLFQNRINENGEKEKYLAGTFETGEFWHFIRTIKTRNDDC